MSARTLSFLLFATLLLPHFPAAAGKAWAEPACRQEVEARIWTAPLVARPGERNVRQRVASPPPGQTEARAGAPIHLPVDADAP